MLHTDDIDDIDDTNNMPREDAHTDNAAPQQIQRQEDKGKTYIDYLSAMIYLMNISKTISNKDTWAIKLSCRSFIYGIYEAYTRQNMI